MKTPDPSSFRLFTIIALTAVALIANGRAYTLVLSNLTPTPNPVISGYTGQRLPVGSGIVAGGFFTISDAAIMNAGTVQELAGAFEQFAGSHTIDGAGAGEAGLYDVASIAPINPLENAQFTGQTIYTFIGNGDSFATSTEALVVKHVGLTFEAEPLPGTTALLSETAVEPLGAAQLLYGAFPGPDVDLGPGPHPTFVTVPELSRLALSLLALAAAGLRRRRQVFPPPPFRAPGHTGSLSA